MSSEERVELRGEVYRGDMERMIQWLQDEKVTAYLNEEQNVDQTLRRIVDRSTLPLFSPQLNRDGRFFMITVPNSGPIGFLRLVSRADEAEIVVVIGDRSKWGKGLGYRAILKGVRHAFSVWRKKRVVAKIHKENRRSRAVFHKAGFKKARELDREVKLVLPATAG